MVPERSFATSETMKARIRRLTPPQRMHRHVPTRTEERDELQMCVRDLSATSLRPGRSGLMANDGAQVAHDGSTHAGERQRNMPLSAWMCWRRV